ncbi:hypothetical protein GCK32_018938 [Trichostrongylus colubriformis]|uniref:Neurotransmitter-gated ion-channel ligand-binding domain-containing protein n=1 Tax=Trichostrongylus colubriformis TaxID=6319 RepID=A0AAN8EYV7_TRICO
MKCRVHHIGSPPNVDTIGSITRRQELVTVVEALIDIVRHTLSVSRAISVSTTTTHSSMRTIDIVFVCLCIVNWPVWVNGSEDEYRLIQDLRTNYDPIERPVANHSEPIRVNLRLILQQLVDVSCITSFLDCRMSEFIVTTLCESVEKIDFIHVLLMMLISR